jgi:two-component system sensor histidine kinase UhpB
METPRKLDPVLAPAVEQGVYRVAQEALDNVVRHAQAGRITVALEQTGDNTLRLRVADDGLGVAASPNGYLEGDGGEHMGIQGMRERAALIGGQLEIVSKAGEGTEVFLSLPG